MIHSAHCTVTSCVPGVPCLVCRAQSAEGQRPQYTEQCARKAELVVRCVPGVLCIQLYVHSVYSVVCCDLCAPYTVCYDLHVLCAQSAGLSERCVGCAVHTMMRGMMSMHRAAGHRVLRCPRVMACAPRARLAQCVCAPPQTRKTCHREQAMLQHGFTFLQK